MKLLKGKIQKKYAVTAAFVAGFVALCAVGQYGLAIAEALSGYGVDVGTHAAHHDNKN